MSEVINSIMNIGKRIKEQRKKLGYTADYVANGLGVSRSTIFRYENGSIEKVPTNILSSLAKILHTTPEHLLSEQPDKFVEEGVLRMNSFVLPKSYVNPSRGKGTEVIRVNSNAYDLLVEMQNETGIPIAKIASKAVEYAYENLKYYIIK